MVTGLTNGTVYTFRVRAVNSAGAGLAAQVTGQPNSKPAAPIRLGAAAGNGKVTLSWDNPKDASITNWRVRHRPWWQLSYSNWTVIPGSTGGASQTIERHTVSGLTNNSQYYFEVVGSAGTFPGNIATVSADSGPETRQTNGSDRHRRE